MSAKIIQMLAGLQENVNNVPLEQGKVLFAVHPEETGAYTGYIYYDFYDPNFNQTVRVSMGNGGAGGGGTLPALQILDIAGNSGPTLALTGASSAYLKLPDTIEANYFASREWFLTSHNLFTKEGTSRVYGNGFIMSNPFYTTKQGWIRTLGEAASDTSILELAMGDSITDNNITNTIVARLYDKDNNVTKEAILLNGYGNASFPGDVTANLFIGDLRGNADTATRAEQDKVGMDIQTTYLASIAEHISNGETYAIKGVTGAGEIKCIVEVPNANDVTAGIITTGEQTLTGKKIFDKKGGIEITGIDAFNYSGIQVSSDNYDTTIWFSQAANKGIPVTDGAFTYNAHERLLKVRNISGDYEIFPNFFGTNIQGIITNAKNDELDNNIVQHYVVSLRDSLTALYQSNKGINYTLGGFNAINGEITSVQIPNADEDTAGIITNATQYLKGFKSLNGYLFFPNYCLGEDLFVDITTQDYYDSHPTGIRGEMSDDGTWMISGREGSNGIGFLEIGVGKTGAEPIYFTQYQDDTTGNIFLKKILTLMDANGGTVMHHLTITDDYDVREASTDFGLKVAQESVFLDHIYTAKSLRFGADEGKVSLFYIYPDEELGWQTTDYKETPYYAYLESLLLQDALEVIGRTVLRDTLITRDILPDEDNIYRIGQGTPNDSEDLYYWESYIRNMFSNKLVLQGPVEGSPVTPAVENPKIIFQNNTDGFVNNPIHLIYSDHIFHESYDQFNGLRLTGEYERSYLDIDGTIYSRYDGDNYVRHYSESGNSGSLITANGIDPKGLLIHSYIKDNDEAYHIIQRNIDDNYVKTAATYDSNILESVYKTGSTQQSVFRSTVTPGSSTLRVGGTNNSFFEFKSDLAPSEEITIKTNNNIYTTWESNLDYGFNLYSRFTASNYLQAYKNVDYGLYFKTQYDNDSFIEQFVKNNQYEFTGQAADGTFIKQSASPAGTFLQMYGVPTKWTYIRLNNGVNYWDIGTKSTTDSTTSNLAAGSLQIRRNNSDNYKIAISNDEHVGIELYGELPYIDFHWMGNNKDFSSRIQATAPMYLDDIGTLDIDGQVIFKRNVEAHALTPGSGTVLIGDFQGKHLAFSDNKIVAKSSGYTTGNLYINEDGGRVFIGNGGLEINSTSNSAFMFSVTGPAFFNGDVLTYGNYIINGQVSIEQSLAVKDYLTVGSYATIGGSLLVGQGAGFGGDVLPTYDNEFSLGSPSQRWKNLYTNNLEAEWIKGYLDGTAKEAEIAYGLANTLTLVLNGNNYTFDGTSDMSLRWYAPTYTGNDGEVLFWDNNKAAWLDPEWVFEIEQGQDGKYLPLAGGTMLGALNFKSGVHNQVGIGCVFSDDSTPGQFWLQGINANTSIALRSFAGSEYDYTILITNDGLTHQNTLNINAEICNIGQKSPASQGAFRMVGNKYGAFWKNNDIKISLLLTNENDPFGPSNGLEPFWIGTADGICHAGVGLMGGLWNDYAEFRESDELEPGRCVYEVGDDSLTRTTERLMPACNIVSDTFGFAQGETDKAKTPIATAGRVLAYTYEYRDTFKPGDAVCSGPNGTVSKMTREEIREWPDRIVGTVSCVPTYEYWGENNQVKVNGRIWIKVK